MHARILWTSKLKIFYTNMCKVMYENKSFAEETEKKDLYVIFFFLFFFSFLFFFLKQNAVIPQILAANE